ncbi:hypothetical protein RRG08_012380 [Elysia crispata]|uniref:Uncharacterized protein n=1 Tax=Elysia crispata TaxID=231223 RepID=A0AAE0YGT2_9GAST|nr:hypothetical protein RRG08_012380 [Elysia crispata]
MYFRPHSSDLFTWSATGPTILTAAQQESVVKRVTDIARLAVARQLPPSAGRPGAHTPEGHKWLSVSSPASCRHDIHILHYLFKDLDIPYRTNWPCHTPGERKRKEQKFCLRPEVIAFEVSLIPWRRLILCLRARLRVVTLSGGQTIETMTD